LSGSDLVFDGKVYGISADDLKNVAHLLRADDLWSTWANDWCGIVESAAESDPDAGLTAMTIKRFNAWHSGRYTGESLESAVKNRNATDRASHAYADAINSSGTLNIPMLKRIAKTRGEWDEGKAQAVSILAALPRSRAN